MPNAVENSIDIINSYMPILASLFHGSIHTITSKKNSLALFASDNIFLYILEPDHHRLPFWISLIHLRRNYTVTKPWYHCITASLRTVILWKKDLRNRLVKTSSIIAIRDFNLKRYLCLFSPFKVWNDLYHSNKSAVYVVMSNNSWNTISIWYIFLTHYWILSLFPSTQQISSVCS